MDTKQNDKKEHPMSTEMARRSFLKVAGTVGAAAAAAPVLFHSDNALAAPNGQNDPDPTDDDADVVFIHSSCQMCHGRCGLKAKVKNGVLLKIDGNPWHPNNMGDDERLTYATTPAAARSVRGRMCPKGQAGIQTLYDPYRIQHPLKRVGARGSGQWEVITWQQAFQEIAAKINALIPFASRTTNKIDPSNPDIGPLANQLLYSPGRSIEKEVSERIFKSGYGTANYGLDHTSICEVSHHVGNELITQDTINGVGGKSHFKPDFEKALYTIVFGANPVEANFPMVALSRKMADMQAAGGKVVVVDPRLSNSAAKADLWIPVRPGGDAALAMGIARVMIEGNLHNAAYLRNANKAAATAAGEPTYTDSTWLVIVQAGHPNERKFLTTADAGLTSALDPKNPVCIDASSGNPVEAAVKGASPPAVVGELLPGQVVVNGIACKTAFELYYESVMSRSLHDYAVLCGVAEDTITQVANEFAAAGRKASAWTYRGVVQHVNGTYNQVAVMALNALVGNYDYAGGMSKGGAGYDQKNGVVNVATVPNGVSPSGVRMDRAKGNAYVPGKSYFKGYPARRPWFPLGSHGNYQEIIPSIQDGYPYPAKVLITYWNAWPYSVPGGKAIWEQTVSDEVRLPLFVAISPVMGEVPAWADYILPDSTYLEKWAFPGGTPTILTAFAPIQQPVVGKYDGVTIGGTGTWTFDPNATNEYTPFLPDTKQMADILIGLAKAISPSFPGVGANAFADGGSCDRAWDVFRREFANLAQNTGKTVAEILDRGGVFEDPGNAYDPANPNLLKYKHGGVIHLYLEPVATTRDSITGEYYSGTPIVGGIHHSDGTPVDDAAFPYQLVTYHSVFHAQARTAVNPWLMAIMPENGVEISTSDAHALGIETGDRVRVWSASNPAGIIGKARVLEGLRPGVIAVSHSYGHWELNSRPYLVNGQPSPHDPSRGAGITANPIMRLDDATGNSPLQDPIGASASFNDTRVQVALVDG